MSDPNNTTMVGRAKTSIKAQGTEHFGEIPREALAAKLKRTGTGLGLVGLGVAVAKYLPAAPWWVPVGLAVAGAHVISGELVAKTAGFFVGLAKSILAAKKDAP